MILLDSDLLLIDLRYPNDPRAPVNSQVLQELMAGNEPLGITQQVLLEVVGILSFNTSPAQISALPAQVVARYSLNVLPDPQQQPAYAGCTVADLLRQMNKQMALGDAVQAVQIVAYASGAQCLLTWNSRHFVGKLPLPVLAPPDWLARHQGQVP